MAFENFKSFLTAPGAIVIFFATSTNTYLSVSKFSFTHSVDLLSLVSPMYRPSFALNFVRLKFLEDNGD